MTLIYCDECGAQVSDKAASCPKCGNPLSAAQAVPSAKLARTNLDVSTNAPANKNSSAKILSGLLILAILIYGFYKISQSADHSVSQPQGQEASTLTTGTAPEATHTDSDAPSVNSATPRPTVTAIKISAYQLFAEYKENEVLADTKYKGKALAVGGIVTEIGKDFTDDPYVTLDSGQMFMNVRANFSKSEIGRLSQLHKGESVELRCYGNGMIVGSPILDCTQSIPAEPTPQPSAQSNSAPQLAPAPQPEQEARQVPATAEQSAPSVHPSFDCTKALSVSERLICGDSELATEDVELAGIYARAMAAAKDQTAFADGARLAWNNRERTCRNKACLLHWYAEQKLRLENIAKYGE